MPQLRLENSPKNSQLKWSILAIKEKLKLSEKPHGADLVVLNLAW